MSDRGADVPGPASGPDAMEGRDTSVTRQAMSIGSRTHRSVEERIILRFPRLGVAAARLIWRQPSRALRRLAVRRFLRLAWEAFNRGDYEATFMLYRPDTESVGADVWGTIGSEMRTRSRDERVAYQHEVRAEWETLRFEPEELIEVGDEIVLSTGLMKGVGRASGASVDTPWAVVLTLADGAVRAERIFVDRADALRAAGVRE